MATKKTEARHETAAIDDGILLLNDYIREVFVHNARLIAENEKPERLLKMIQTCPKLKPATPTNHELWKIVQRVRQEVLGERKAKRGSRSKRKTKGTD